MSHKTVDCRGLACPQPVLATKRALENFTGMLIVTVDNSAAKENVTKFASFQGCGVCIEEVKDGFDIKITKGKTDILSTKHQELSPKSVEQIIMITQDTLGHGSVELGAVLMKGFLLTVLEKEPRPKTIMFINSGVKLTVVGSPVLKLINSMSEKGIEVLSCGTCLDFYEIMDKLAVGEVTNMFTIVEKLSLGQAIIL